MFNKGFNMMRQRFAQTGAQMTHTKRMFMQQTPKRLFSQQIKPPTSNFGSYALIGLGTTGLVYLMMKGMALGRLRDS